MMQAPLTPASADLRDFPAMMLDVVRLRDSDLTLTSTGDEFKAAVLLWAASWHQVPAGSLPDDERVLAGLARVEVRRWVKLRPLALKGWTVCGDGRLYHPVIAEKALECWVEKINARISSGAGNAKKYGYTFDRAPLVAELDEALALLQRLNPKSRAILKARRATKQTDPQQAPGGTPGGSPLGSQEKGSEGITLPERASALPEEPNKEAWRRGVALLVSAGRMPEPKARQFFGRILRDHQLEAKALLPSIVAAEGTGTQDPQGYFTKAAQAVARRAGGNRLAVDVTVWSDEVWVKALENHSRDGAWSVDAMGPEPGQPGCRVPAHLLLKVAEGGR